jgi:hemoglobin-like flavoprotein
MDDHTISLVRESFDLIEPIAPQAGAMFYANLFEADPSLQGLFKGNMEQQAAKLMQMIAVAVAKLDQPEVLMPVLDQLGRRHAGYGVQDQHYDTVGAALLKTLYQGLGVAYNEDVEEAWVTVYAVLAARMKAAARLPTETTSA